MFVYTAVTCRDVDFDTRSFYTSHIYTPRSTAGSRCVRRSRCLVRVLFVPVHTRCVTLPRVLYLLVMFATSRTRTFVGDLDVVIFICTLR